MDNFIAEISTPVYQAESESVTGESDTSVATGTTGSFQMVTEAPLNTDTVPHLRVFDPLGGYVAHAVEQFPISEEETVNIGREVMGLPPIDWGNTDQAGISHSQDITVDTTLPTPTVQEDITIAAAVMNAHGIPKVTTLGGRKYLEYQDNNGGIRLVAIPEDGESDEDSDGPPDRGYYDSEAHQYWPDGHPDHQDPEDNSELDSSASTVISLPKSPSVVSIADSTTSKTSIWVTNMDGKVVQAQKLGTWVPPPPSSANSVISGADSKPEDAGVRSVGTSSGFVNCGVPGTASSFVSVNTLTYSETNLPESDTHDMHSVVSDIDPADSISQVGRGYQHL